MSDIVDRLREQGEWRNDKAWDGCPIAEEAAKEITRLREEIVRYKLTYAEYVEAIDRMNGTPCEQIRHQQEVDALREENARLREALAPFVDAGHLKVYISSASTKEECWVSINIKNRDLRAAAAAIREGGIKDE